MREAIQFASSPLNRQARENQENTAKASNWRQFATISGIKRRTELTARSQSIGITQLASSPLPNGKLGELAGYFSSPVRHTRKGGERRTSPANCLAISIKEAKKDGGERMPNLPTSRATLSRHGRHQSYCQRVRRPTRARYPQGLTHCLPPAKALGDAGTARRGCLGRTTGVGVQNPQGFFPAYRVWVRNA